MPNHHRINLTHPRAEKRQDYVRIYVAVRRDASDALRDSKDGKLLGWTDWSEAVTLAGRTGMIVVNWAWFLDHYLAHLPARPPAARIHVATRRERRTFHVEFSASVDEVRTLNMTCPSDLDRIGREKAAARTKTAKVWEEEP